MADESQKVQRQIVLPLRKAVEITMKSLRIRFWRALITTSGVVLGIAFLMSIFTTNLVNEGLNTGESAELKSQTIEEKAELHARQIWLVGLSLLVCIVGITNAMLMSVTERFREIGTMKCLGALDSFIWKLFLLESLFQGFIGSLIGIIIGSSFVLLASLIKHGGRVITTFPGTIFLGYTLIALFIGVAISAIGALLPASQAAKMVPAIAMRSEI